MFLGLVVAATEAAEEGTSHTPFYLLGGLLAAWAVAISVVGIRLADRFPPKAATRSAVILVTALLVAATTTSAVLTG